MQAEQDQPSSIGMTLPGPGLSESRAATSRMADGCRAAGPLGAARSGASAAVLLALLTLALPAPAQLPAAAVEPLWLPAAAAHDGDAPQGRFLTLRLPSGWMPGDAVVVALLPAPPLQAGWEALSAALLQAGAAVAELPGAAMPRERPGAGPAMPEPDAAGDLSAVALALRRDLGAGVLVAVGLGESGGAALGAALADADPRPDAGRPRFAAGAWLSGGRVTTVPGAPPPPDERWDLRAPLLRDLLVAASASAEGERSALAGSHAQGRRLP